MTNNEHPDIVRFLDLCEIITRHITHLPTEKVKLKAVRFLADLLKDIAAAKGDDAIFVEMLKKRLAEQQGRLQ